MSAPESVIRLVERFENNIEDYRSGKYNETQIRREFIDPLFKALGWDVDNEKDFAERYKDVVHEDSINVAGSTKAPDYSFRVWGTRKFFVEAKKPSVNLKDDTALIYEYEEYHKPGNVWPEVIDSIRSAGILDMQIYRSGFELIMVMTVSDSFSFEDKALRDSLNPLVVNWERLMDKFQLKDKGTDVKWQEMPSIFRLSEHESNSEE